MKSIFKYIFALLAICSFSIGSALAGPALVIGIDGCSLFDGNGGVAFEAGSGITVSANSANGNVMHTCSADVIPPDSGRSAIFSFEGTGALCGIDGTSIATDDWHQVVSRSGKAKLVCHFKTD